MKDRDRIVRTIVFFDLPNIYPKDKRNGIKWLQYSWYISNISFHNIDFKAAPRFIISSNKGIQRWNHYVSLRKKEHYAALWRLKK